METTNNTAEALKYSIMVPSILDTQKMVVIGTLARTTSGYKGMVTSMWESGTKRMERYGKEAQGTSQMAVKRSMTID